MKSDRQKEIIKIIRTYNIETQDDLITHLNQSGYIVTQATISRDIRELNITKSLSSDGKYTYSMPKDDSLDHHAVYGDTITRSVRSVNFACNTVVLKTYPGLANAVAAGIDSGKYDEVLGCVAGDDTIIVITKDDELAKSFSEKIAKSVGL
ncbi:MAG: arginine repressor [Ruminococcaceae bacterium]|nr:arginine repressor [Oscillospiraceae bacterium]